MYKILLLLILFEEWKTITLKTISLIFFCGATTALLILRWDLRGKRKTCFKNIIRYFVTMAIHEYQWHEYDEVFAHKVCFFITQFYENWNQSAYPI